MWLVLTVKIFWGGLILTLVGVKIVTKLQMYLSLSVFEFISPNLESKQFLVAWCKLVLAVPYLHGQELLIEIFKVSQASGLSNMVYELSSFKLLILEFMNLEKFSYLN